MQNLQLYKQNLMLKNKINTYTYTKMRQYSVSKMFVASLIVSIILPVWSYNNYYSSRGTQIIQNNMDNNEYNVTHVTENEISSNRSAKFLGWWSIGVGVVRFENSVCAAANGLRGTCYTRRQCSVVGGFASGKCARNIGFCCVVQVSCGAKSANNNTYFSNPSFPNTFPGGTSCQLTIQRCNPDICQVRIDFLSLILSQPNGDGVCVNDALFITGAASPFVRICGENSGQHIYLDFNNGNDIELSIFTSAAMTLGRQWNIRVSQIGCDSPNRAPSGCLMYYTELSGTVRSFNYGQTANALPPAVDPTVDGTRQIANMNYGICVSMAPGYCSIQWSPTGGDVSAFTVSDVAPPPAGAIPMVGDLCITDFVVIPNGRYTAMPGDAMLSQADRFCGNTFLPVTTFAKPFVLTAVTNGVEEAGDVGNRGFSLSYTQQRCGNNLIAA